VIVRLVFSYSRIGLVNFMLHFGMNVDS
jgi:hypothetical protein